MKTNTAELQNVIALAWRLAETPDDQTLLALDRINDVRVAIAEWERQNIREIEREHDALKVTTYGLWAPEK